MKKTTWNFDNSYTSLPKILFSNQKPAPVPEPKIVIFNHALAEDLGLDFSECSEAEKVALFSGNTLPENAKPIAQAYAGHQFGHFTVLGDGRAVLLGEHITLNHQRFDIQLKGSGQTKYSRRGDGRATLGSMLREYIISEAMFALGIPTTRSLAVLSTGENIMREMLLPGGILTRVAASHIRVGTFEYLAMKKDMKALKALVKYSINRHYFSLKKSDNPALDLLKFVMEGQIQLIVHWMRVGFIHGVMNTDNMSISGETLDYGPCAFMDVYDPNTVFSSIDNHGRYAFCNQAKIAQWNLTRFAETMLPLLHKNQEKAIQMAVDVLNNFDNLYQTCWTDMMRKKLGILSFKKEDEILINDLLEWMEKNQADYTNTFFALMTDDFSKSEIFQQEAFQAWHQRWQACISDDSECLKLSAELMRDNNPAVIPRNQRVEEALQAANEGNFNVLSNLLKVLSKPYVTDNPDLAYYQLPSEENQGTYQTFCGT